MLRFTLDLALLLEHGQFGQTLNRIPFHAKKELHHQNLVIVSVHWGDELIDRPSMWQRLIAREFIGAGASLIVGHHPHVVQGVDSFDGALIAYSLGNFIFDFPQVNDCATFQLVFAFLRS